MIIKMDTGEVTQKAQKNKTTSFPNIWVENANLLKSAVNKIMTAH